MRLFQGDVLPFKKTPVPCSPSLKRKTNQVERYMCVRLVWINNRQCGNELVSVILHCVFVYVHLLTGENNSSNHPWVCVQSRNTCSGSCCILYVQYVCCYWALLAASVPLVCFYVLLWAETVQSEVWQWDDDFQSLCCEFGSSKDVILSEWLSSLNKLMQMFHQSIMSEKREHQHISF